MLLAQAGPAIERARLQRDLTPPSSMGVDANGTPLGTDETTSEDDSFGAQMILKSQERLRSFVVTGSASVSYTDNVALTRRGERYDVFAVVDAGLGWSRAIAPGLEANIGGHVSIFRYDRTPALDFENIGFGAGLSWAPQCLRGASVFGRYDFTELLDSDGDEILREHAFTLGIQKAVTLGRSHGFVFGASGTLSVADPDEAERQQIGAFVSYYLQLTRHLQASVLYRPAMHFYPDDDRTDFNQIISSSLRYHLATWAELTASFSFGVNRSDRSVFDYDVLTAGGALVLSIRF